MKEVLTIGIGNIGCEYISDYFNKLNDYLNVEAFNKNLQFDNAHPRVILIDHIDGFNSLQEVNTESFIPHQELFCFSDNRKIKKVKYWLKNYLFGPQIKHYNFVPIDSYPTDEASVGEYQKIINNMLLCENIIKNPTYKERLDECLRNSVEKCDNLSGFELVTDNISPYYMIKCDLVENLNDDYSSKVVVDFSLEKDEKSLPTITRGFLSISKLITYSRYFQNYPNCFVPYNVDGLDRSYFVDCIHQLNSLWTLPNNRSTNTNCSNHSLNQFVYDVTNTAFGMSIGGLIGCAFDPNASKFESLVNQLDSWSQLENGLGSLLNPTHPLVPHSNQLFSQYMCVGECRMGLFKDFTSKISNCKWRNALNLHIPVTGLTTADIMDGFLRYNYYGTKSFGFISPKVLSNSKNNVISFFNGKQSYNYIYEMYRNSEKYLNSFFKKIPVTEQYNIGWNKDAVDDILSHTVEILKLYDSTKAFEDFGEEVYDDD